MRTLLRRLERRDERGSLAPAVPVFAVMLLALAGLGIDGSRQLNARGEAVAYAEEASRAGAQGVDTAQANLTLDPTLVSQRVRDYCNAVLDSRPEVTSCQQVGGLQPVSADDPRPLVVEVEVKTKIKPTLLGIVYTGDLTAGAKARARPYEGITQPINEP